MKSKTIVSFIAAGLLACLFARAEIGGGGAGAGAGLIVGVTQTATGPGFSVSPEDVRDVVKALEILEKYAPAEFDQDYLTVGTTSGTFIFTTSASTSGGINRGPTKAQKIRDAAEQKHRAELAEADRLEKEQAEIKWARGILQKWRDKKALLDR